MPQASAMGLFLWEWLFYPVGLFWGILGIVEAMGIPISPPLPKYQLVAISTFSDLPQP
ncbi:hypothetical protein [Anabaena sp. CCY 0017]|uniref:hypothetical protein n=1 Tax=Anabaena sp. CCY 0017 TaxID=3103866 RepID=UPI0039C65541